MIKYIWNGVPAAIACSGVALAILSYSEELPYFWALAMMLIAVSTVAFLILAQAGVRQCLRTRTHECRMGRADATAGC